MILILCFLATKKYIFHKKIQKDTLISIFYVIFGFLL